MGHEKIPLIHEEFRDSNNHMNFHFAVYMDHKIIFTGFSQEIQGIFIKIQIIVPVTTRICISFVVKQLIPYLSQQDYH